MDTDDYPMTPLEREENYNTATCLFKFVAQWHYTVTHFIENKLVLQLMYVVNK